MGWFGKLVGGTIGFALGGPLGAIAGTAFGHMFDTEDDGYDRGETPAPSSVEVAQMTFFVASFSMLAKLARADGRVSKEEIDTIEDFIVRDLNLNAESRNVAVGIFQAALESPETFQDFAGQFYTHFRFQPRLLELMIDILLRVSISDGSLNEYENRLIRSAVRIFGFTDETYARLKSRYVRDLDKYYAILESSRNSTDDQIKRQHRKLAMEYHPDRIASKGLPEEFNKFAHDKFREIQEAYETIKKERKIN